MQRPNWDRTQEIYHAALALPCAERNAFVAQACAGNAELLREVSSLLEAVDPSGFLVSPVIRLGVAPNGLVGTTIDERYFVDRQLCNGGMSHLYLALDLRLSRREVVVKILSEASLRNSYARNKFNNEIEALARVRHESVVNVLDCGELPDGRAYLVMEYIDGETLRSQIPNEGMNLQRAATILKQIGEALAHVHGLGIIHRDLKPENIMLRRLSDEVVLVDFGIAKLEASMAATNTVEGVTAGTVVYMSPEQLRGERITAASDVYSLAVIAYELVTGRRPFNPTSASQLLELQRAGVSAKPIHLRPNLSSKAQQLILRGLSFKPVNRCQRASQFGDDLARELEVEVARVNRWQIKLSKTPLAVACALVVLMSVAVVVVLSTYRRATLPERSFTYWLTVQKIRDRKNSPAPFHSNGQETFENDDKCQLNVLSPATGYLYVFNEGSPQTNDTSFKMIYPRVSTNKGSATVGANQTIQSGWIAFRGVAGDENVWIVWSVAPVSQLESAKVEAFKHPRGGLTDKTLLSVKEFLRKKQSEMETKVTPYEASTVVQGTGDMLITLLQFKHR